MYKWLNVKCKCTFSSPPMWLTVNQSQTENYSWSHWSIANVYTRLCAFSIPFCLQLPLCFPCGPEGCSLLKDSRWWWTIPIYSRRYSMCVKGCIYWAISTCVYELRNAYSISKMFMLKLLCIQGFFLQRLSSDICDCDLFICTFLAPSCFLFLLNYWIAACVCTSPQCVWFKLCK